MKNIIVAGTALAVLFTGCSKVEGTWSTGCVNNPVSGDSKTTYILTSTTLDVSQESFESNNTTCTTKALELSYSGNAKIGAEKTLTDGNLAQEADFTAMKAYAQPFTATMESFLNTYYPAPKTDANYTIGTKSEVNTTVADMYTVLGVLDDGKLYQGLLSADYNGSTTATRPIQLDINGTYNPALTKVQ